MKKLFIILAVMAIVIGCTEQHPPQFGQVWKKINKPEEARAILAKVNTSFLTESGQAEYGLLKTIIMYKTHRKLENDSLISASIAYYNRYGDDWLRSRAYLYRGIIRMYRFGNIIDALKDFKVAEHISERNDDEELKSQVYQLLAHVNYYFRNQPSILKYSHKLLDSSIELNDSTMMVKSLLMCATAHADMDQLDSAFTYIMKGVEMEKHANMSMLSDIYSLVSELYAEKGEAIKAEEYLQEWKQLDGTHATHTTWYLIPAYIRKAQGEYEKAIQLAKMGLEDSDQRTRWKCLVLLSELYELTGNKELASETRMMMIDEYDDLKYNSLAMQMVDWQQKFDDEHHSKDFYIRMTWMQVLIIALIVFVVLAIGVGMWLHRRKVRRLSFRLDEDARRISELRTNIEMQEKSGAENSQEMARLKEELENRMERISGTLLIGTQMYSQLQQRQCIAEATAKEQQCLVDYFAQLRPKRWQEWERKYSGLSTAQYIFLIMQDDLHFDDEAIAAALNVKRTSVRSMRSRIKGRER